MAGPTPAAGPPPPVTEPALAEGTLLSAIAGAVDGIGYLLLHVFTAHVTGNTVRGGTALGAGGMGEAARALLAVALFALGVAVGAVIREGCARRGWWSRPVVLVLSAALLAGFAAIGRGVAAPAAAGPAAGGHAIAALAAAAIGIGCSNAVMPRVGGRRVRTFITGTVVELVEALVAAAGDRGVARRAGLARAGALGAVWAAYLAGATFSGWAGLGVGSAAALAPAAALAALAVREVVRGRWPGGAS